MLQSVPNLHIVIHSPYGDEDYFQKEFSYSNVTLLKYDVQKIRTYFKKKVLLNIFMRLRLYGLPSSHIIKLRLQKMVRESHQGPFRHKLISFFISTFTWGMHRSALLRKGVQLLDELLYPGRMFDPLLQQYRPDVLMIGSLGYWLEDALIMRSARRCGTKIVSCVLSWDNPTMKGLPGAPFDSCFVWTDIMKKEIKDLLGVPDEKIVLSGVAHFDMHFHPEKLLSKAQVLEALNVPRNPRLLFFGMGSPKRYHRENLRIAHYLGQSNQRQEFGDDLYVVVRPHPNYYNRSVWDKNEIEKNFTELFSSYRNFVVFMPLFQNNSELQFDLPAQDYVLLSSLLKHSDVFVSFFSTMNLEASLYDRPIVNVSYHDHIDSFDAKMSEARLFSHNQRIIKSEGVRIAETDEEIGEWVQQYLRDGSIASQGRAYIRETECGPLGGGAGQRMLDNLLQIIDR